MSSCCKKKKNDVDGVLINEKIKQTYEFECENNERRLLWEGINLNNPTGTLVITALETCDSVRIYLNEEEEFEIAIQEGQTVALTVDPLTSIEIECRENGSDICRVELCLSINYFVN